MQRHATSFADLRLALPLGRLAYADTGTPDAPVVVCLHAIGHGSADYAALFALLGKRLRLIALDWPGQGRSEAMDLAPDVHAYARLLEQALDALNLPACHLVGNSVGGGAALVLAARRPDRVRSLVLSNPAGLDRGGWGGRLFCGLRAWQFRRAARRPEAFRRWFAAYCARVLPQPAASTQRVRIAASALEIAPLLARAWQGFGRPVNDLRSLLPDIMMPVQIAWAAGDRQVSWARNRAALGRLSQARIRHFDAGHAPALECPEAFAAELASFLNLEPHP